MTFDIGERRQENVKEDTSAKEASELSLEEDTARLNLLRSEVEASREVCAEFLQLNRQERQDTGRKPLLKPRDLPLLELGQLKGVEGEGRLAVFLAQMEDCAREADERKRTVVARVDAPLAIYVQAVQREKSSLAWAEFKEHLAKELTDRNPSVVYDTLSCFTYHLDTDPMEFVAKVKCKFAVLGIKGDGSEGLSLNKIIKAKMISSLPRSSRERLELFKSSSITLERFIELFTQERTIALAVDG